MATEAAKPGRILVVDDVPANVELLVEILRQIGYTEVIGTSDSTGVLRLVAEFAPDLIVLDLHMPEPDGFALLEMLRAPAREDGPLPVIVLTADVTVPARQRALRLGASDFLTKPFDAVEVVLRTEKLLENRFLHLRQRDQNRLLEQRVRERTSELERARLELLERLALLAEYRDDATYEHTQRVGRAAGRIAAALALPELEVELIERAAPLHDIGKVGIPDSVLLKPGRFTADERSIMVEHVTIGAHILAGSSSPLLQLAEEIALSHHERWDGRGYVRGLRGEEIPLAARIVAVADVFDALTHARPYKNASTAGAALAEIVALSGTHLDARVVGAFRELDHAELLAPITSASDAAAHAELV